LAEIIDLMQVLIDEKEVELELKLPSDCHEISSDQVKLRQILQNLIDNAVKFSHRSKVIVELLIDENGLPESVSVTDSGPGIENEQLEVIFDAFQQGDNGLARRFGGAGLGLAIARSFADLLGLEIEVDSVIGQGSTFTLHFKRGEN
jgi:signal transduction histidine kinase